MTGRGTRSAARRIAAAAGVVALLAASGALVGAPASAAPSRSSTGCAPTRATMPAGALHARIPDVDGDGRADTEWAQILEGGTVRFGVTTASGATASAEQGFAGGGSRSFVMGTLADGVTVALPSEGRTTRLYSFSGCRFHAVRGTYDPHAAVGNAHEFWFYDAYSAGAAGCIGGRLYGFHSRPLPHDRVRITGTLVDVSRDGRTARTAGTTVLVPDARDRTTADASALRRYDGISCGGSKVLVPVSRAR